MNRMYASFLCFMKLVCACRMSAKFCRCARILRMHSCVDEQNARSQASQIRDQVVHGSETCSSVFF